VEKREVKDCRGGERRRRGGKGKVIYEQGGRKVEKEGRRMWKSLLFIIYFYITIMPSVLLHLLINVLFHGTKKTC
jgi:hypothetical protein